jgi:hypothetical protein
VRLDNPHPPNQATVQPVFLAYLVNVYTSFNLSNDVSFFSSAQLNVDIVQFWEMDSHRLAKMKFLPQFSAEQFRVFWWLSVTNGNVFAIQLPTRHPSQQPDLRQTRPRIPFHT